ncbi:hypothetical protein D187_009932 [Cystobacter fuscus DSM 2262]|uniref:Uncharacterized protein n=1 Tax=Cystobacter fuscus (strain ATCC 25194 / DSM 2262 / NBRC 100088 / M29) TaxID=1242864 RepID=S9QL78_CYSF2|nr:hypothetical protein D187_009932 [Cystobacter fuscus DSM 2262]
MTPPRRMAREKSRAWEARRFPPPVQTGSGSKGRPRTRPSQLLTGAPLATRPM